MTGTGGAGRHRFEILGSQLRYCGGVFAVRSDEVAMPGGTAAHRDVIEHFGAVAIAPLDGERRLVMIHQYRHPLRRRLWELPAGLLDVDGEDVLSTARRELAEETGLAAAEWSLLADVASSPGMTDEVVRIFLAQGLSTVDSEEERGLAAHNEEADLRIERFAVDDAVRMVLTGEIINATTVAGVLATHAILTGAARPRPATAPWPDRPTRFAARRTAR